MKSNARVVNRFKGYSVEDCSCKYCLLSRNRDNKQYRQSQPSALYLNAQMPPLGRKPAGICMLLSVPPRGVSRKKYLVGMFFSPFILVWEK